MIRKLIRSFRKSGRIRRLQLRIAPPGQSVEDVARDFVAGFPDIEGQDAALEEFPDLCEEDEGVAEIMRRYQLTRNDLQSIYDHLVEEGLGQWINGHLAALSSIAYREPLLFYVESQSRGVPSREITYGLLDYWKGRIPNGGLYRAINLPSR